MRRPDGVTMTALWFFFNLALAVLGLAGMSLGFLGLWTSKDAHGILFGTVGMTIGVMAILLYGAAHLVVGLGLWRLREWSRPAAMVLAAFQLLLVPIGTIVGIIVLVYLSKNRAARAALRHENLATEAVAP